jgi:hypothetical protein
MIKANLVCIVLALLVASSLQAHHKNKVHFRKDGTGAGTTTYAADGSVTTPTGADATVAGQATYSGPAGQATYSGPVAHTGADPTQTTAIPHTGPTVSGSPTVDSDSTYD